MTISQTNNFNAFFNSEFITIRHKIIQWRRNNHNTLLFSEINKNIFPVIFIKTEIEFIST